MMNLNMDRVQGTLVGQFVGDALGATLEFKSAAACRAQYPEGLTEIVGGGPFSMQAGQVTDDGELALALARTLVLHGVDPDARARGYAAWMQSNPPDKGLATVAAFGGWPADVSAVAMVARTAERNGAPNKQANGALMRVSPLALYTATMTPERTVLLAKGDAQFSHPSEVCQMANAAFVRAIQVGMHGGTPQEAWEAACAVAQSGPVFDALHDVKKAPVVDSKGIGWVLAAMRMAFHQLLSGRTFEEALVSTVMAGGDTDTNGAIAGALLGAFHGLEGIPARWWAKVQACRPASRPAAYHPHDALQLAEQLVERGRADGREGSPAPTPAMTAKATPTAAAPAVSISKLVHEAGGKLLPHERDPSYQVAKIPLANERAAAELERILGAKAIRGSTYFIFPLPKTANEGPRPDGARKAEAHSRPGVRTSSSDPINVSWLPIQSPQGKVGLTFAPGKHALSKHGDAWERDLAQDLDRLKGTHGVDVLVCLLQDQELHRLNIPALVTEAEARGITVHRLPIQDGGTPPHKAQVDELVGVIRRAAEGGKKVVIHCQGGLGRAGTVGGCYLRRCGVGAEETLKILVQTRGRNCPENDGQRDFIRNFR